MNKQNVLDLLKFYFHKNYELYPENEIGEEAYRKRVNEGNGFLKCILLLEDYGDEIFNLETNRYQSDDDRTGDIGILNDKSYRFNGDDWIELDFDVKF